MQISYFVKGGYALLCFAYLYNFRPTIFPIELNHASVSLLQKDYPALQQLANEAADDFKIQREITLVPGHTFLPLGNRWFTEKIGLTVNLQAREEHIEFFINHCLVHLSNHDLLVWRLIPLMISLFTVFLLQRRWPTGSYVAGTATALASLSGIWRWRERVADITAFQRCSQGTQNAVSAFFKEESARQERELASLPLLSFKKLRHYFWTPLLNPTYREKLAYCSSHTNRNK